MIWDGVHTSFDEVVADEDGFVHPRWVEKSVARLRSELASDAPSPSAQYSLAGAVLAAAAATSSASVLDVGGNLGQTALDVRRRLPNSIIDWTVVEREDLLTEATQHVQLPSDIEFVPDLSALRGRTFDVLHLGSVLQYFEDWRGDLASLTRDHTHVGSWLVISDAMVGASIPSFVTRQAYYERGLPMHFLNLGELISWTSELGYRLMLQEPYLTPHTSKYYPEQSLPSSHRIEHPLNLVLRRES